MLGHRLKGSNIPCLAPSSISIRVTFMSCTLSSCEGKETSDIGGSNS
jgi:hypothetical protein